VDSILVVANGGVHGGCGCGHDIYLRKTERRLCNSETVDEEERETEKVKWRSGKEFLFA